MHTQPARVANLPSPAAAERWLKDWSARNPGAVLMAGLLAFAGPLKFFVGYLGVLPEAAAGDIAELALWWLAGGLVLWLAMLVAGHAGERLKPSIGRTGRACVWIALACACAALANLATAGRARLLIEHGVVQGALPMQLYGFALAFTMAMLYFAHLGRTRVHESATARLAAAQTAHRESRRRLVQNDLQALQARIAPTLLFGMLEAVRTAYTTEPLRAERLLDELIAFLRASLPHLRASGSTVSREAELARAYAQLLSLAQSGDWGMTLEISQAAMHARFPPGALLPLVDDALRSRGGQCSLEARCADGFCRIALRLPAPPSPRTVDRVQALLREIDGAAADLSVGVCQDGVLLTLRVPYAAA